MWKLWVQVFFEGLFSESHFFSSWRYKTLQMPFCKFIFYQGYNLKKHVAEVHEKMSDKCELCSKSYSQKGILKTHISSISSKEKTF